jgi:hypothetical protein
MKRLEALATVALAFLILSTTGLVFANPIAEPGVNVQSPVNNQNYMTPEVELKAVPFPYPPSVVNFTIKYYILDDKLATTTNGTAVLTDLSSGSHTLKIYGTFSSQYSNSSIHEQNDTLVSIVYFSVIYSTRWVIFAIALTLVIAIIGLTLYRKRRQIKTALKGEKNGIFSVGLVAFVLSSLSFVFFTWQVVGHYLFPYWPPKALTPNYNIPFVLSLFFLSLGLLIMLLSCTKKPVSPKPITT